MKQYYNEENSNSAIQQFSLKKTLLS